MELSAKKMSHILVGGTIGNLTEWYNFLLYGYLAPIISELFFPTHDKLLSLILAFTVFAVSFLVRPLGGILFGWIGDTYGRQRALVISLMMITIPSLLISFLPSYRSIGVLSPILLSFLRIFQGLSAGGEHTGSAIYVAEFAPSSQRSLWVTTVPASAAFGILISSAMSFLVVKIFSHDQLLLWGWRAAYWFGAGLGLISLVLRMTLPETPSFQKMLRKKRESLLVLAKDRGNVKSFLLILGLTCTWGVFYQILFIWMPTYLSGVHDMTSKTALALNCSNLLAFISLMIVVSVAINFFGRKDIIIVSCLNLFVFSFPLFSFLSSGIFWQICLATGLFTIMFSLFIPAAFVSMVEIFPTEIRYTGLSFSFNVGLAVFGGTCPLIATGLIHVTHSGLSPAFYLMAATLPGLLAAILLPDRSRQI